MPVTAKLSREFYEKFGDTVVDELINLLNTVDIDSKAALRELNEANFARFDANVKQRFAEENARIEQRFAEQSTRMEQRFAEQNTRIEQRFTEQQARMEQRFAEMDVKLASLKSELIKWMFLFFMGSSFANYMHR